MGKIENRLAELGHELPAAGAPKGNYVNVVRAGDFIYTGTQSERAIHATTQLTVCPS
jgi:hypothetical protein